PVGLTTTVSGGQYKLDIPNIIPTTPPVTVSDGSHINFTVNGAMAAESGTWHSGIPNLGFNLTAIAAPPPAVGDAMISLSPDEGLLTTVSGTGFSPTTEVAFTWDGDAVVTVPATVTVESNGTFAAIVVAPAHVAGDYAIVVTDDTDRSAEATFTVITAEKGEAGAPGEQGMPGEQGQQGERGEPGEEGTAGSDAGNVIGIVAIILAVIAILLATVFRMRIRKLPTL
ncbi:MAG: hypothetical protein SVM79_02710, partial [Chloroflexota bacterium]|nr:hypothetical protein [Chloroflexota bacterium]